jgi:putative transposase
MRVLSEIKNRGTQDCLIVVCDGLKGLPEAVTTVWPQTSVQTCIVHYSDTAVMPRAGRCPLVGGGADVRDVGITLVG